MNESNVCKICLIGIVIIILIVVFTDTCQAQGYFSIDTVIVDSVLYEGRELVEPSYFNSPKEDYNQYFSCKYGDHDWVYKFDHHVKGVPKFRVCRYCLRWEIVHNEKRPYFIESEYTKLIRRIKK